MNKMSEDEAVEILRDTVKKLNGDMEIKHTNYNKAKAIETILDLCQKEKEKNDLLTKRFRHLIKSKIISSYDKVKKGKYIKDINKFDTDYINKDKIRAKIKEYEEINMDIFTFEVAEDLKELLKEE